MNMILIKNGEVHVGNGQVLNGFDILIDGSTIKKVEKEIGQTEKMKVIDASGCVVLPGFVNAMGTWGANGPAWGDNDLYEHTDPVTPQLNSVYAFDHEAMNFQGVYEYGVTSFGFAPSRHNVIGGRISVFKTYGSNPYSMLVREDAGMAASVSGAVKSVYKDKSICPMTKMGIYSLLKQSLYDARNDKESGETDPKREQLKRVLKKELPLFVNCTTKADIDGVRMLQEEFDLEVVLTGAYCITDDPDYHFPQVVLGNLTDSMLVQNYHMDIEGIKNMMKNGTRFAVSTCGDAEGGGKENLLWDGILYYRDGIPAEDIIQMMTLNPAEMLGVSGRVGSVEEGKDADIVIWSGNPILTFDARIQHCFISGQDMQAAERRTTCW